MANSAETKDIDSRHIDGNPIDKKHIDNNWIDSAEAQRLRWEAKNNREKKQ